MSLQRFTVLACVGILTWLTVYVMTHSCGVVTFVTLSVLSFSTTVCTVMAFSWIVESYHQHLSPSSNTVQITKGQREEQFSMDSVPWNRHKSQPALSVTALYFALREYMLPSDMKVVVSLCLTPFLWVSDLLCLHVWHTDMSHNASFFSSHLGRYSTMYIDRFKGIVCFLFVCLFVCLCGVV